MVCELVGIFVDWFGKRVVWLFLLLGFICVVVGMVLGMEWLFGFFVEVLDYFVFLMIYFIIYMIVVLVGIGLECLLFISYVGYLIEFMMIYLEISFVVMV